jgi:dinuclear metal center YbgI/SA1388 family protein
MTDNVSTITKFLNKTLNVRKETKRLGDSSRNGLQISAKKKFHKIGFAVDAALEVFKKAKALGCDFVITHHGMLWKGHTKDIVTKKPIKFLKQNKMSLYACHLPLDLHKEYGNNAQLCKLLGMKRTKVFDKVGYIGVFPKPKKLKQFVNDIEKKLGTKCKVLGFGKNKIKKVAICSGGAGYSTPIAVQEKVDTYLTGEPVHSAYHWAKTEKINVIFGKHYNTETVGVKALKKLIEEKFKGVKTVFVDCPTGI